MKSIIITIADPLQFYAKFVNHPTFALRRLYAVSLRGDLGILESIDKSLASHRKETSN